MTQSHYRAGERDQNGVRVDMTQRRRDRGFYHQTDPALIWSLMSYMKFRQVSLFLWPQKVSYAEETLQKVSSSVKWG